MRERTRKYFLFVIVVSLAVSADVATKATVEAFFAGRSGALVVIPGFFQIVQVHNPGGVGQLFAGRLGVLVAVTLVAMGVIAWMLLVASPGRAWEIVALAMLFGGAAGNLYDRLRYGYVRDFLDFHIGEGPFRHYPAFNVADSVLVVGAAMLALGLWGRKAKPSEDEEAA
ncbi:MAG: signal peptidase II [Planctomycetota bacterium]